MKSCKSMVSLAFAIVVMLLASFISALIAFLIGRDIGEDSAFTKKANHEERLRTALYEARFEVQRLRIALQDCEAKSQRDIIGENDRDF